MSSWMNFWRELMPGRCIVCHHALHSGEHDICYQCLSTLPFTRIDGKEENLLERLFWEQIPIERASALFTYIQGAQSHQILRHLKYLSRPAVGISLGRLLARRLIGTGFFDTISLIVPVPLSAERMKTRGYNQAERIATGIAEVTDLPVDTTCIVRVADNKTQTSLSRQERINNVKDIFHVKYPEQYEGKHLLLVDDVVTTGSTLIACGKAFGSNTRFSILTLALAASFSEIPYRKIVVTDETENGEGIIILKDQ